MGEDTRTPEERQEDLDRYGFHWRCRTPIQVRTEETTGGVFMYPWCPRCEMEC